MQQVNIPTDDNMQPVTDQQQEPAQADDQAPQGDQQKPEQPQQQLLAGKYKTEEELGKGIVELAKKFGKDPAELYKELERNLGTQHTQNVNPIQNREDVKSTLSNLGIELEALENEFLSSGSLSEASYQRLEKAGIPRSLVDSYIQGQISLARQYETSVLQAAGLTADEYQKIAAWASQNLTDEEIDAYNTAVNSGISSARLAIEGLLARYNRQVGQAPQLISGEPANTVSGDVYQSIEQMVQDMSDPRYQTDPAYRERVMQKLARSNIL